jgi:hypothetical protein
MLDVLAWPPEIAPRAVTLRPRSAAVVGPPTLSGRTQVAQSDAGYWELVVSGMPVGGAADVATYRAFLTSMEGGARGAYVPVWDYDQAPWPSAGGLSGNTNADKGFTGGFFFTGGYGFYNPAIKVYLNGAHSLRATSVTVTVTAAGTIRRGQVFSLVGGGLHVIREKTSTTVWSIWPPLRRDYPTGMALEFGKPTLKAIMASTADGDLGLNFGRYGSADITFRELIS